jgi:DNA-binding NarL/FixJ family response regulator
VKRLMIVDANPAMRQILVDILESIFSIEGTLSTGGAVLREASRLNPDIILLDVSLGDMSGFAVAERLQEAGCKAKIVFVSVHESVSFIDTARRLGASGYIFKSQIDRDLMNALRSVSREEQFVSSATNLTIGHD